MMIGILCALGGATIRLPRSAFIAGQALIGCLIARAITASLLTSILQSWPFMAAAILGTVAASTLVGWLLVRRVASHAALASTAQAEEWSPSQTAMTADAPSRAHKSAEGVPVPSIMRTSP